MKTSEEEATEEDIQEAKEAVKLASNVVDVAESACQEAYKANHEAKH